VAKTGRSIIEALIAGERDPVVLADLARGRLRPKIAAIEDALAHRWTLRSARGVYYELFVIIEIYSRYVVAWTVAAAETGELAKQFIDNAITGQRPETTACPQEGELLHPH